MVLAVDSGDLCAILSKVKVIVLDLDRTLWSHPDVTSLIPPFNVTEDSLVDSRGEFLKLNECVRRFLDAIKNEGEWLLAIVSWNKPQKAEEVLELLNLSEYFDVKVIEYHPRKDMMFEDYCKYYASTVLMLSPGKSCI
jgi:magnesium-dependent phosphatase-1